MRALCLLYECEHFGAPTLKNAREFVLAFCRVLYLECSHRYPFCVLLTFLTLSTLHLSLSLLLLSLVRRSI